MKKHIFDPLGMKNTLVYDESKPEIKSRAAGMNRTGKLNDYEILTSGAGGMYSTVEDLFIWDQALYGNKLVSQKTLEEAFTPAVLNDGSKTEYGFGWGINEQEDVKLVQHSGALAGYRTFISRDITNNRCFILLTSKGNAVNISVLVRGINNILNEKPYELPEIPISNILAKYLKTKSTEEAIDKVKTLLKDEPDKYTNDETGINALGYAYMADKDYKSAKAAFKANIKLNPNSSNVYDSYGELLMNTGDTAKAIKYYTKSVELNPANKHGLDMLAKMGVKAEDVIPKVTLSEEQLEAYVGKYELNKNLIITVTRKGNKLFGQATGQSEVELHPASTVRFYLTVTNAQLTFNMNDKGKVISLTLHQEGDMVAKKIE
jgi:tetratricopeptide (TPR) repeat protein